jgi:prevent-host-death family protein
MKKGLKMVAYTTNELVSSTDIGKKFGSYLKKVENHEIPKIGILKNNQLKAVLLSSDDYEKMQEVMEFLEDTVILEKIKDRLKTPKEEFLDGEEVLKSLGLSLDDV